MYTFNPFTKKPDFYQTTYISGSRTFTGLNDTPGSFTNNRFLLSSAADIDYSSSNLTWDNSTLSVTGDSKLIGSALVSGAVDATLLEVRGNRSDSLSINGTGSISITSTSGTGRFASVFNILYEPAENVTGTDTDYIYGQYYDLHVPTLISGGIGATKYYGHYELIRVLNDNIDEIYGTYSKSRNGGIGGTANNHIVGAHFIASSDSTEDVPLVIGIRGTGNSDGWNWENGSSLPSFGTAQEVKGVLGEVVCEGGIIDNGYAFYASDGATLFGGTINTSYGLYLEDQTAGSTNYTLYSAGGENYFGGPVSISGSGDTLFKVSSNHGPSLFDVDNKGALQITTASGRMFDQDMSNPWMSQVGSLVVKPTNYSPNLDDYCIWVEQDVTASGFDTGGFGISAPGIYGVGAKVSSQRSGHVDGIYLVGLRSFVDHDGSNTANGLFGVESVVSANGEGDTSSIYGIYSVAKSDGWNWDGTDYIPNPGVVTNSYGLYTKSYSTSSGTIINNYGLYIDDAGNDFYRSAITNNYGIYIKEVTMDEIGDSYSIYSESGKNYFGGDVTTSGVFNIPSNPPATSSGVGTTGDIAWDVDYIYICVANNTWKRSSLASW